MAATVRFPYPIAPSASPAASQIYVRRRVLSSLLLSLLLGSVLLAGLGVMSAPSQDVPQRSGQSVVVGAGDTYWSIAQDAITAGSIGSSGDSGGATELHSQTIEGLVALNGDVADLRPGDVISLPTLG